MPFLGFSATSIFLLTGGISGTKIGPDFDKNRRYIVHKIVTRIALFYFTANLSSSAKGDKVGEYNDLLIEAIRKRNKESLSFSGTNNHKTAFAKTFLGSLD